MEDYINEIKELKIQINKLSRKSQSDELNELFTALAKAQAEIQPVKTNQKNPFFKADYANLKSIVEAARPALTKHGLSVIQLMESCNGDGQFMITKLCHTSGQWIESRLKLQPVKPDVQTLGSYITYVRRYLYASLIGVVTTDEDDDGATASNTTGSKPSYITAQQVEMIEKALEGSSIFKENILKELNVSSFSFAPADRFDNLYKFILQEKAKKQKAS